VINASISLSKDWIEDRDPCRRAGIPKDRHFMTKPQLTQQMLECMLTAGVPVTWVTGDSV
jgi:SRSO17 transposase